METLRLMDHLERLEPKIGFIFGKRLPISSNFDIKLLEKKDTSSPTDGIDTRHKRVAMLSRQLHSSGEPYPSFLQWNTYLS